MTEFLFLMHDDTTGPDQLGNAAWAAYLRRLDEAGILMGGSAIGAGTCARRSLPAPAITRHLTGFIRIRADSLDHARTFLHGNPVFEAGGTVEIRELPRDG